MERWYFFKLFRYEVYMEINGVTRGRAFIDTMYENRCRHVWIGSMLVEISRTTIKKRQEMACA